MKINYLPENLSERATENLIMQNPFTNQILHVEETKFKGKAVLVALETVLRHVNSFQDTKETDPPRYMVKRNK